MEVITHWAGNIVSYLVFLTVLTGLLPAHKYEKYIRLFAGCILLLIVLKPLTDGLRLEERLNYLFTSLSFENEAGELKREMDEIEVRRRNMVLSQYEAEASKEAVRVAAEAGFSVEKADVELEKDPESEQFASVRSVTVYVAGSEAGMEAAEQEDPSSMIEIEKISPIEISLEQEQKQGEPAAAQAVSWMNGEKIGSFSSGWHRFIRWRRIMWKSGWNLDREWVKRNEKWLILLVLGLAILILYAPFGKKTSETGVWQSGERWAESGTGTNSGNRAGQDKNGSSEESGSDVETGLPGTASRQDTNRLYELRLEQRIRDVLKKVDGVGEVDVMLTLFSSSEKVLRVDKERSRASTSETDSSGGTRQQADESLRESTVLAGSSGSGEPVVEKELAPEISGIVISAQGGGNASVQKEISEAMQALFGLPAHKIKVLKRVE